MYYDSSSDLDDNLMQKAFNIDEQLQIPEGYQLDPIDQQCMQFLRSKRTEENKTSKSKIKHKKEKVIPLKNCMDNEFYRIEIEENWRKEVLNEFCFVRSQVEELKNKSKDIKKLSFEQLVEKFNLDNIMTAPDIRDLAFINNNSAISLIEYLHEKINELSLYSSSLYIYYFLSFLDVPLVDDSCSILYMLNKQLVELLRNKTISETDQISCKILYVIITDFFNQRIIVHNIR